MEKGNGTLTHFDTWTIQYYKWTHHQSGWSSLQTELLAFYSVPDRPSPFHWSNLWSEKVQERAKMESSNLSSSYEQKGTFFNFLVFGFCFLFFDSPFGEILCILYSWTSIFLWFSSPHCPKRGKSKNFSKSFKHIPIRPVWLQECLYGEFGFLPILPHQVEFEMQSPLKHSE